MTFSRHRLALVLSSGHTPEWFDTLCSYDKLVRVVARMLRFINLCRHKVGHVTATSIICSKLAAANLTLVKESQRCHFFALLLKLARDGRESSKPIAPLRLFIDYDHIIRVRSRLRHSSLSYDSKQPMLFEKRSHLALLLVRWWLKITCHSGPRHMTALISRQYWIISVRSVIHDDVRKCLVCIKFNGRPIPPLKADLHTARVQECWPF